MQVSTAPTMAEILRNRSEESNPDALIIRDCTSKNCAKPVCFGRVTNSLNSPQPLCHRYPRKEILFWTAKK